MMRALDGSLEHWRSPHWDLYLRDDAGRVHRWGYRGGRCGNVNPIRDEDYVALRPGESRDDVPGPWAGYLRGATVPVPGRYTVWVVYRFCGPTGQRADLVEGVFASDALSL
ncbi:MAG TPA: hypothetical protein RMH99_00150, partial [Sandaracinaceae bacterium LLY-WYZ-13_1]|nr:hypothetical protein [Sandaracinaceae bacterium LLY-WYZ-13_1]